MATTSSKWGFILTDPEFVLKPQEITLPSTARTLRERVAEDGTLKVFSKKSERQRKKQLKRGNKANSNLTLLDLPFDVLIQVVSYLRPSDVFRLSRTCHPLHSFLLEEHPSRIARSIIQWRYACLEKCFRLPVLVSDIQDVYREVLQDHERLKGHDIRRRPYYQHVKPPDSDRVCTCLTCVLRWNVLGLAVDFSYWQDKLDSNEPLPMIPRGRQPEWNIKLLDSHAAVVEKALFPSLSGNASSLWYAVILEAHLDSTVRAVRRHSANKFNKRKRFLMTPKDAASGTDEFLQLKGPPSLDFPFHRDNYYMLEAYLPNRSWFSEDGRWGYMPAEQHDKDIEQLRKWVLWRRSRNQQDKDGEIKAEKWVMEFNGSDWKPVLDFGGTGERLKETVES
ncbi:hypothetical protein N0V93_003028 [Gnomoniopsis smithogilvyi]|uniref:F-box domain-containing protein n=1 Tax=Gnomoniopsis smithogilvyi TaxID=1191159 RepID=A0A9W8YYK8_9PEZI|nr:hypothetical protein N0V93_003028 [Gnomoniopsis smithogilvyi]